MTIRGVDISNHQGPPSAYRSQPWYRDAAFVIVQAIRPPQPYMGWEVGGYTADQLRAAKVDGKKVGIYVWLWNSVGNTASDIQARLALAPSDVQLDMRPWLDVEDTGADTGPTRQQDVLDALGVMDDWALRKGLPRAGVYSGGWYIDGYLGGWFPEDRMYWMADYSIPPSLFPARPIHQYTSTPIDINMMLESELIGVGAGDPVTDVGWQLKKDIVVQTAGELLSVSDQLLAEANRKGGPRVREIRRLGDREVRRRAERILA